MKTADFSSVVDSDMDDTFGTVAKPPKLKDADRSHLCGHRNEGGDGEEEESIDEEFDKEVWDSLTKRFREVQSVLDQNRSLIQQANDNHQSNTYDNLVKNVALIQEINSNIFRVRSIYSELSVNFSSMVRQRRATMASKSNDKDK